MNLKSNQKKTEFFSCRKAIPVMLKFRFSLLKYFFQHKNYPLFIIRSSDGGIIKTYEAQKKLKLSKFVRHNNHYYFSLTLPHWPSKAFDHMVANGGLNITAAGTRIKKQIDTAILGITRKCSYECNHCYEHFNLSDSDTVPVTTWKKVIAELQDSGVSIITLSGGEPVMRYEAVLELLRSADHSRSDFHMHTSGFGVTQERTAELKMAGLHAAGVGLDDCDPDRNDRLRGTKGAHEQAVRAIKCFQEAGIFTYVNSCLTKELIHSGELMKYFEMLKDLNVGIVRWLEPKPCGGYFDRNPFELLSSEEKKIILEFYDRANTSADYADYPLISYEAFYETPENMGCMMAGNSQLYIDTLGNVEPCVFLPVSFGNIIDEDFSEILFRMREAIPSPLMIECPSVQLSSKIKSKKETGIAMPVPYEELTEEFESFRRNNA
jgi:MoaA/NifB/PqqE/SkfB family radical SAM enzyme